MVLKQLDAHIHKNELKHHLTSFIKLVMPQIARFQSMMDHIYSSGPRGLQWSEFPCKKWKDMWFGKIFFFHRRNIWKTNNIFLFTHVTSILSAQITSQSISHWCISAQRSLSPITIQIRGCHSPLRSSLMVFRVQSYKFFLGDIRSCRRTDSQELP